MSTSARELDAARLRTFGANVRRLREVLDLTQEQLAERSGLDPRTVRHVEAGTREVGVATTWPLAEALEVDPGALFEAAPNVVQAPARNARARRR